MIVFSYPSPTFCELCGQMLWGLFRQGLQCDVCGVNCHRRCKADMPNLCGVNQKLIAEALLVIKSQKSVAKGKVSSADVQDPNKINISNKANRSEMPLPETPMQTKIESTVPTSKVSFFPNVIRISDLVFIIGP